MGAVHDAAARIPFFAVPKPAMSCATRIVPKAVSFLMLHKSSEESTTSRNCKMPSCWKSAEPPRIERRLLVASRNSVAFSGESAVGRFGILAVSLVAAVPGLILSIIIVSAIWNYAEAMSGTLLGLSAVTLIVSAAAMLTPFGIFLFAPKAYAAQGSDSAVAAARSDDAIAAAESGEVDPDFGSGPATMEGIAVGDSSDTLDAFSDSEIDSTAGEEFDLGDIEPDAGAPDAETTEEDFDFDFDDEEK